MSIIYRSEKGAPLTSQEVDDNFRQLDERMCKLERQLPAGAVHEIRLEGDFIIIRDPAGVEISRVKIPLVGLNPRGVWAGEQAYARNDLVTHQGVAYVCLHTHKPGVFKSEDWLKLWSNEVKHESK